MAKLTIMRHSSFMASARAMKIILDGEKIDSITNGELKTIPIPEGKHTLQLGISKMSGMSNKLDIEVEKDEEIYIDFKQSKAFFPLYFVIVLGGVYIGYNLSNKINMIFLTLFIIFVLLVTIFQLKYGYKIEKRDKI